MDCTGESSKALNTNRLKKKFKTKNACGLQLTAPFQLIRALTCSSVTFSHNQHGANVAMRRSTTTAAAAATITATLLSNHMHQILFLPKPRRAQIKQVRESLLSFLSLRSISTSTSASKPPTQQTQKTHKDLSSIDWSLVTQSVISKFPHLFDKGQNFITTSNVACLKDILLDVADVVPGIARRYRRSLRLEPRDVLELLLGFQFESEKVRVKTSKVESLWRMFNWASGQDKGFRHLPEWCEVMASVLIRYELFREVQLLLLGMERQGIRLESSVIFGGLIEGYVGVSDLERAVLVYDQMREHGLVPTLMCFRNLIDLSVKMKRTQLAFRLSLDLVEIGFDFSDGEKTTLENVVTLICREGMIKEGRNLIKRVAALGLVPSSSVINEIACGYSEKKDFEDSLKFFIEMGCSPNVLVGNKILYSLCSSFGVERADFFRLELEHLGFKPDDKTFGIFICRCCKEGDLKSSFYYLSEMLSRGLQPDVWSYNALIGALFREGMWEHASDILDEMVEREITSNLSTFKILLAGYCKFRQFDEVKGIIYEMVNRGLIESSSLEDPLSKAFMIVGLDPSSVRLKRDNNAGFSKTEFFDDLGNGLYLDTDLDEFQERVSGVLEDSLVPDINFLIKNECDLGNFKAALLLIEEMVQWGQEPILSVFSAVVKGLSASCSCIKACTGLLEKMPKLADKLDQEVLNLLVRAYCKRGLIYKGRIMCNQMLERDLTIEDKTYTALVIGLCKKGTLRDLHDCWDIAKNGKWLPGIKDFKPLVEGLCKHGMLKEVIELLESMMGSYPYLRLKIFHAFLEQLSIIGHASIARVLVEELLQQDCLLDDIAYGHLLRGLCKERKTTVAFTLLDAMLERNLVPCSDVSLTLIPQLCKADRYQKAVALTNTSSSQLSIISFSFYRALIKGLCMTGNVGEAANLFLDMLSKGLLPDAEICNILFQGYCQDKNFRKARELLGVLIRKSFNLSISSYRSWVHVMCMDKRFLWAFNLKDLMLTDSKPHSLIIYNILIFYLLSAGNNLLVNKVLNELQEKGLSPDEVTHNFLVHGFLKCRDLSNGLYYLSAMVSEGLRPSSRSLRYAMNFLCWHRKLGEALDLSGEMELRGWAFGSIVQNAVVESLLFHDKVQEAEQFLDRIIDKDLVPDTITYDNLIKQFCCYGRLNKAVALLNIMLQKGNMPNATSYDSVINGLCKESRLSESMDFLTEMLDRDLKPRICTWDLLLHKFCRHGLTTEAERLLSYMVQVGETPTRTMYLSVIDRYRQEHNLSKASELMQMMQRCGYEPDFDSHWSLISNLSSSNDKDNGKSGEGFLSRLLSGSGFPLRKDQKFKLW